MLLVHPTLLALAFLFNAFSHAWPTNNDLYTSEKQTTKRATPNIVGHLVKRANPTIGSGIDTNDPHRGGKLIAPAGTTDGGFSNALELMSYANTLPAEITDPIFAKYFFPDHKLIVQRVFSRLLGSDGVSGAPELANINAVAGTVSGNDPGRAELLRWDTENPELVIEDDAFVYPNRDEAEGCDFWEDGMTEDMYLLGSILLHEYTHWDWLLNPIHHGQVVDQDNGYGWKGARALDKSLALYNADSYAWYATEVLWASLCNVPGGYNDPDVAKRSN
jgi:hypothetical protein